VIHSELDELRESASKTNSAISTQLATMNEQIVSLFGKIEERFENCEVTSIATDALDLGALIEAGQMKRVAALANQLKGRIEFLFNERLPSLQNRKILHIAQKLADQSSQGDRAKLYSLPLIGMLKALIQEALTRTEQLLFPEEAEIVMELYEIADLYSHHYLKEARHQLKMLLPRLPSQAQSCLQENVSAEESANILIEMAQNMTQGSMEPKLAEYRA
jgi:hypothetical protein